VRILFGRVRQRRPEKSILLTGLRGVGKTVPLDKIERLAVRNQYRTISVEAHEGKALAALLAPPMRKVLYELDCTAGAGDKVRRGLAVLKSFLNGVRVTVGEVEIGLDIDPERGAADGGSLESDLPNLFLAVAEAAQERQAALALFTDEVQCFSGQELSARIMAMHKLQQVQPPLVLVGVGLPILPDAV
jgi:hypothetical protein